MKLLMSTSGLQSLRALIKEEASKRDPNKIHLLSLSSLILFITLSIST
jgi:hypothetical protein